jgi:hypothetical protein
MHQNQMTRQESNPCRNVNALRSNHLAPFPASHAGWCTQGAPYGEVSGQLRLETDCHPG